MRIATEHAPPLAGAVALASLFALCNPAPDIGLQHRHTIPSEAAEELFGFELDADGDMVIVGDPWDHDGTIRILRAKRRRLVEEARFLVEPGARLGDAVAMHGDRAAALLDHAVQIYERDRKRRWTVAATVPTEACEPERRVGQLVLDDDFFAIVAWNNVCVWEHGRDGWRLTARFHDGEMIDGQIAAAGGRIAIPWRRRDRVGLYARDGSGVWRETSIAVENPYGLALSRDVLAVDSDDCIELFDVRTTRAVATLRPQSHEPKMFGAELDIDDRMLVAWAYDGVHVYRRTGSTWKPAGILPAQRPKRTWFGSRLALTASWLWVGDPDMGDRATRGTGYVHGYQRR